MEEIKMIKYLSIALSFVLLAGCFSKADDPLYNRIDWQQTDDYKACKSGEAAAVKANKAEWTKYNLKLAKAKAEYPQKLKQYERALKDYKQNGGLMPLGVSIPELSVGPGPLLLAAGKCFNPPKNFKG